MACQNNIAYHVRTAVRLAPVMEYPSEFRQSTCRYLDNDEEEVETYLVRAYWNVRRILLQTRCDVVAHEVVCLHNEVEHSCFQLETRLQALFWKDKKGGKFNIKQLKYENSLQKIAM